MQFEANEKDMGGEKKRQMKILKSLEGTPIVKSTKQSRSSIRAEIQAKFVHYNHIIVILYGML